MAFSSSACTTSRVVISIGPFHITWSQSQPFQHLQSWAPSRATTATSTGSTLWESKRRQPSEQHLATIKQTTLTSRRTASSNLENLSICAELIVHVIITILLFGLKPPRFGDQKPHISNNKNTNKITNKTNPIHSGSTPATSISPQSSNAGDYWGEIGSAHSRSAIIDTFSGILFRLAFLQFLHLFIIRLTLNYPAYHTIHSLIPFHF